MNAQTADTVIAAATAIVGVTLISTLRAIREDKQMIRDIMNPIRSNHGRDDIIAQFHK